MQRKKNRDLQILFKVKETRNFIEDFEKFIKVNQIRQFFLVKEKYKIILMQGCGVLKILRFHRTMDITITMTKHGPSNTRNFCEQHSN